MVETSKLSPHRLTRVLITIGVLGVALAVGVYYWPGIRLGVTDLVQQMTRIQQRLASANYTLYKRVAEQQWVRQILVERNWLLKSWLIWGGLIGVILPVIVFLVTYGSHWWRLLLPPSPSRDSEDWWIARLIQRKVIQAHWRTNWFNLEQAVLNVLLLGLSCFSLQLVIHSYILTSRPLMRAGMLSFLGFSYACFFFYLYIKRCSLHQAADMLDDRLRLKQGLVTSLDIQPSEHSRLRHFLLADTAIKIKYKSIPQLFPYHPHRIKASYFLLQLGFILLATPIITLVGPQRDANPLPAESSIQMEELINQQARQIKVLSHELEQHLPSSQLPGVAGELGQLAQELLVLGDQPGVVGIAEADAGYNYQGAVMPQGSQSMVSGIMASFAPPSSPNGLVVEGTGSAEASSGLVVSPEEMRGLMASLSPPPSNPYQSIESPLIPQAQPESSKDREGGRGLSRISAQLVQIAQQVSGLNGGESPLKPGVNGDGGQEGKEAKTGAGNDPSLTTVADRLNQLAHQLKQTQLPTSAQVIKHNLWLKGEQLEQLAQRLSQGETTKADAQTAATEDNAGEVADRSSAALSEQRSEIRMVAFELSRSAQGLKEWDAIIQGALSQQERVELIPYSGQYGHGEASTISGKRSEVFPPEVSSRPRLRTGGESAPHSHAQVTNVSLNNSYQETTLEEEQSRRAIIARGYNRGSSSHPVQVKLGQGQRDQPLGKGVQTAPNRQENWQGQPNQDGANQQMATANPADQYRAWKQWGKQLELASLTLTELANSGIVANINQSGERGLAYQPQVESAVLNYLGNQLGQFSAQLYKQFSSRLDYSAPAGEGLAAGAGVLSKSRVGETGVTQELNRLQNQALRQLAEELGSLSQGLLGLAHDQPQAAEADTQQRQLAEGLTKGRRYELLGNLAQDLGLISQGLVELGQLSRQNPLRLQGLEDREPGEELTAVEEPVRGDPLPSYSVGPNDEQGYGTRTSSLEGTPTPTLPLDERDMAIDMLLNPNSSTQQQPGGEDAGQMGNMQQQAREIPTNLRDWANELDSLSAELAHLAKDERERRLLARRKLNFRNYQDNNQDRMSMDQAVDPQNGANQDGGPSRTDDISGESQSPNLKLSRELQELADKLEELAKSRNGADGWLEPKVIIEKSIQKISQASSELKSQAEPSQQLDRITDELDQLAQELSQLQPSLPIFSSHLGGGAQPTAMEQIPSLQMPTRPIDGRLNPSQAQDKNRNRQNYISAFSLPQNYLQDRVKQQLALMKLDELIGKLRQQQTASDNTSSGRGTTGFIDQQQTDFSKGVNQPDDPNGGSELEHTPREGVISGPYPMEENLTQDAVFERIIRRLEESRNRIAQFAIPSFPLARNLPGQLGPRNGNFSQPNLPEVRGLTQWEEQQGVLHRKIAKPPNPFPPNQLISFRDHQEMGKYAKVSTRTQVTHTGSYNHQVKPALLLPGAGQLSLTSDQQADNSVQQQLIPQRYQEIIHQLYQPD